MRDQTHHVDQNKGSYRLCCLKLVMLDAVHLSHYFVPAILLLSNWE